MHASRILVILLNPSPLVTLWWICAMQNRQPYQILCNIDSIFVSLRMWHYYSSYVGLWVVVTWIITTWIVLHQHVTWCTLAWNSILFSKFWTILNSRHEKINNGNTSTTDKYDRRKHITIIPSVLAHPNQLQQTYCNKEHWM